MQIYTIKTTKTNKQKLWLQEHCKISIRNLGDVKALPKVTLLGRKKKKKDKIFFFGV